MNWKIMGLGLMIVLPLIAVLANGFSHDPRALPEELTGKAAPQFELQSLDGYTVSLADLKGSPVVINFWATWCRPCIAEHAQLMSAAAKYKRKNVAFLGVLYGDTAENARPFLEQRGEAYPTLLDDKQRTNIDFGVSGVPETFVIDAAGTIVKKFTGPVTEMELSQVLNALIEPSLDEK